MREIIIKLKAILILILFVLFAMVLVSCSNIQYNDEMVNNTSQDVLDFLVEVSDGQNSINPLKFHCSAFRPISEEDDFTSPDLIEGEGTYHVVHTDGFGVSNYNMIENIAEIPSIERTNILNLSRSNTTSIIEIDIYDSNASLIIDNILSWSEFPKLDDGQYFIVIGIHNEIGDFYENAQFLFSLYV